jgi:hypothetical protein
VVLVRCEDFLTVRYACRKAVNEDFGPFNISLGGRGKGINNSQVRCGEGLGYGCHSQLEVVEHDIVPSNNNQVSLRCPPHNRDADLLMRGCHECVINKPTNLHRPGPKGMCGLGLG